MNCEASLKRDISENTTLTILRCHYCEIAGEGVIHVGTSPEVIEDQDRVITNLFLIKCLRLAEGSFTADEFTLALLPKTESSHSFD